MQNNQKIIGIFGAGGFFGKHLMRQLTKFGYRIKVATRNPYLKGYLKPLGNPGQIELFKVNIFDTKLASKLCRTYSQNHGLKDLVQEFCGKKIDKKLGSSDWNKNLNKLTDAQLQYCSNDVIYLHKIKEALYKMLIRENRLELYESCIQFLKTRIKLDQSGFAEDIFQH